MNKTPTTSIQAFFKHLFTVCLIGVVYILTQALLFPILTKLHDYLLVNDLMLWFGGMISLIVFYLIYWIWAHKETYLPSSILPGLLLIAVLYLYYHFFSPSCYFWQIDAAYPVAWADLFLLPWLYILLRYAKTRCTREEKNETKVPSSQILNRAIESAKEDELDFKPKVDELVQELRELDLREQSTCYGIIAPWGYGKTSFLNLLSDELRLTGDGIIVWFNPRSAKSVERIQEDFFTKLGKELSRYYWGAGLIISRYTKHLGLLDHYSETRLIADALRLLQTKGSKDAVSNAIEKTGKRLYIILDDLDRLTGAELLETIKLIDLNASFKNTVFLVACDKKYANDVLQAHLGSNPGQGYLDKYITREILLQEYIEEKLKRVMAGYLKEEVKDGKLITQKVVLDSWSKISSDIIPHLITCREVKRYFNLFINDFLEVQDYVNPVDFFLITLLKHKDKRVYDAVKYRIRFMGNEPFVTPYPMSTYDKWPPYLETDEPNSEQGEYPQNLSEHLKLILQGSQWEGAAMLLWMLFPESKMTEAIQLPLDIIEGYRKKSIAYYSSIQNSYSFSSYFPDLEHPKRELWHQDMLLLIKGGDREGIESIITRRCMEDGSDVIASLFFDLVFSKIYPNEDQVATLVNIAYIVDCFGEPNLKAFLHGLLNWVDSIDYLHSQRIHGTYEEIINKFIGYLVLHHPLLACELLIPGGTTSKHYRENYVFEERVASEYLLKALDTCLTKDLHLDESRLGEVIDKLLTLDPPFMFKQEASQLVVEWIRENPTDSIWMLLSITEVNNNKLRISFRSFATEMTALGLSVYDWISLIEEPEAKEVLRVIASSQGDHIECPLRDSFYDMRHISYLHETFTQTGLIYTAQ